MNSFMFRRGRNFSSTVPLNIPAHQPDAAITGVSGFSVRRPFETVEDAGPSQRTRDGADLFQGEARCPASGLQGVFGGGQGDAGGRREALACRPLQSPRGGTRLVLALAAE